MKIKFKWLTRQIMKNVKPFYPTQEPPPYLCTKCGKYSKTQYICSVCNERMK